MGEGKQRVSAQGVRMGVNYTARSELIESPGADGRDAKCAPSKRPKPQAGHSPSLLNCDAYNGGPTHALHLWY